MQNAIIRQAIKKAAGKVRHKLYLTRYIEYQDDPVRFGEEVLGNTYAPDIHGLMRSVRDNPITLAQSSNAFGKSHSAASVAVWWYLAFPESQVYVTSAPPLANLQRILWGEIANIAQSHPDLFKYNSIRQLSISRNPKSFIEGVAIPTSGSPKERESKFSGKHAPYLLFIVDEGDAVPNEVYYGIESCMSGGNARMLVLFNPRQKAGPVYRMQDESAGVTIRLNAFDHPNVLTGQDLIPGAVTRDKTVERINKWTRRLVEGENIDKTCFRLPDFLVGEICMATNGTYYEPLEPGFYKITEPAFSYMVLGEYPAQEETQLISDEWLQAARDRYDIFVSQFGDGPPSGIPGRMGLDVASWGPDANIVCMRYGGFVAPMRMWNGIDPDMTAIKAAEIYRKANAKIALVDADSVGAGVAPRMARIGSPEDPIRAVGMQSGSKPSVTIRSDLGEFKYLRDQLWWAVRVWLEKDPGAMLPPDPMLLQELRACKYETGTGKIIVTPKEKMREILRRSPDRADALCLTFAPMDRAKVVRIGT